MAKVKPGLGRGIDNLIPTNEKSTRKTSNTKSKEVVKEVIKEVIKEVPAETFLKVSEIEPNREQPRKVFNQEALEELADSIKQYGIVQPLVVQKKDGYYEIIAGERRWRAAKLAKIKEVPVIIKDYSPQEVMEVALIENIQRQDLNPIEEALAYKRLIDEYDLLQDEVAKKVSKSRSAVTNSMRLLKLPEKVQEMLVNDDISMGHARALLAIDDNDIQIKVAEQIAEKKLSVRETEKLVKTLTNPKKPQENDNNTEDKVMDSIYEKIESKLEGITGSKVTINRKKGNKGKIEIEYYSNEDLERLLELFEGIQR